MKNREEIINILQVVRHTTSDIEKQADRICDLFDVSGSLPTLNQIDDEAESRYPVNTHSNPKDTPYRGSKKTFIHGINWALNYITNYR